MCFHNKSAYFQVFAFLIDQASYKLALYTLRNTGLISWTSEAKTAHRSYTESVVVRSPYSIAFTLLKTVYVRRAKLLTSSDSESTDILDLSTELYPTDLVYYLTSRRRSVRCWWLAKSQQSSLTHPGEILHRHAFEIPWLTHKNQTTGFTTDFSLKTEPLR